MPQVIADVKYPFDVNRIAMRHVRHTNTKMEVDSASDLKILLGHSTMKSLHLWGAFEPPDVGGSGMLCLSAKEAKEGFIVNGFSLSNGDSSSLYYDCLAESCERRARGCVRSEHDGIPSVQHGPVVLWDAIDSSISFNGASRPS